MGSSVPDYDWSSIAILPSTWNRQTVFRRSWLALNLEVFVLLALGQASHRSQLESGTWSLALYSAERLSSFGYDVSTTCFCGYHMQSSEYLSFRGLSTKVTSTSCNLCSSALLLWLPLVTVRHMLFGFSGDEILCVLRVFCYLLNRHIVSSWFGVSVMTIPSAQYRQVLLGSWPSSNPGPTYLPLFFKRFLPHCRRR